MRRLIILTIGVVALLASPIIPNVGAAPPVRDREIAALWGRSSSRLLEVKTMTVEGAARLTVAKRVVGGVARWSPDGRRLGGHLLGLGSGQWDVGLATINADGSAQSVILTAAQLDAFNVGRGHKPGSGLAFGTPFGQAAWSPAGTTMVVPGIVRYEGPTPADLDDRWQSRLFLVAADGSGIVGVVTDGDAEVDDFGPHWSASLGRIVFVRTATFRCDLCEGRPRPVGQQQLWTIRPDGSDLQQLTNFVPGGLPSGAGPGLASPVFSPDGTRLAVTGAVTSAEDPYSADLWLLTIGSGPTVTGAQVLRAVPGVGEWHPSWSPGGDRIVFGTIDQTNGGRDRTRIIIQSIAGGSESVIVDTTKQLVTRPEWRPAMPQP